MGAVRGVLAGALGLVAFETVVQPAAANRVGGLFAGVASIVQRGLDPGVALIPDLRKKTGSTATTPPQASGSAPLAPSPPAGGYLTPRLPSVVPVPAPQIAPYPPPSPS
jgi:hypothetical protein